MGDSPLKLFRKFKSITSKETAIINMSKKLLEIFEHLLTPGFPLLQIYIYLSVFSFIKGHVADISSETHRGEKLQFGTKLFSPLSETAQISLQDETRKYHSI